MPVSGQLSVVTGAYRRQARPTVSSAAGAAAATAAVVGGAAAHAAAGAAAEDQYQYDDPTPVIDGVHEVTNFATLPDEIARVSRSFHVIPERGFGYSSRRRKLRISRPGAERQASLAPLLLLSDPRSLRWIESRLLGTARKLRIFHPGAGRRDAVRAASRRGTKRPGSGPPG